MTASNAPAVQYGLLDPAGLAAMSGLDFMRGVLHGSLPAPPFAEVTDVRPVTVQEGRIVFTGKPSRRFYNPASVVHGGWIALLLDTAMGCAVHSTLPASQVFSTIEMSTNFIRPLREEDGVVTCEATILHRGAQTATAEGKVFDSRRRLVAHGTETCMIRKLRMGDGQ